MARPGAGVGHVVDLYVDYAGLASRVAAFLGGALSSGATAVAICTPGHRRRLVDELTLPGPWSGMPGSRSPSGELVVLDAAETLDRVMRRGRPDRARFDAAVGAVLRALAEPARPTRVFGELVDLLWNDGRVDEAAEIEELWNELGSELPFVLYCAYRSQVGLRAGDPPALARIRALHTDVVATREARTGGEQPSTEAARTAGTGAQGRERGRTRCFPGELRAVPMARGFVRDALDGSDPELTAAALIVASELAANAVLHAGSEFAVTVATTDRKVCLSVADSGSGRPGRRTPEATDEAGRGLQLVDALASRWGVAKGWRGKVVWAEVYTARLPPGEEGGPGAQLV